jgi:hypothetical protein
LCESQKLLDNDRSLSEAARQNKLNEEIERGPGRFGPSRKKEAAARRFGNYELWVLNAALNRGALSGGGMERELRG